MNKAKLDASVFEWYSSFSHHRVFLKLITDHCSILKLNSLFCFVHLRILSRMHKRRLMMLLPKPPKSPTTSNLKSLYTWMFENTKSIWSISNFHVSMVVFEFSDSNFVIRTKCKRWIPTSSSTTTIFKTKLKKLLRNLDLYMRYFIFKWIEHLEIILNS